MITLMDYPPRTMMEVFKMLPEGTLAELIENVLFMSPSPKSKHQTVLNEINFQVLQYFKKSKKGMVYISPLDVYLDDQKTVVQPDLIILLDRNMRLLSTDGYIHGIPDLLIEVLSDHNREHDLIVKKSLYEQFGVKEYWIIDPETKLATGYSMENNQYKLIAEDIGLIKSELLQASFTF